VRVTIPDTVTEIEESAFQNCRSLVRVKIPDDVTEIGNGAFCECDSLRYIQLSTNLISIGDIAFMNCTSLEAVFLPPTVTHIGDQAFQDCTSLKFFYLPAAIEHIGEAVVQGCDQLLTTVTLDDGDDEETEVIQWLMQRHAHLHLHQICCSTFVNPQTIEGCIRTLGIERATEVDDQQMTALHTLCANPHVTGDTIRAYLQLAPGAADQEDSYGMCPFQYLCRSDVAFLEEDRSFSSFMAWWYCCMP